MPAIDVVSDANANVALKWFHANGEDELEPARARLTGQREHAIALCVLGLTVYEIGNALLRGQPRGAPDQPPEGATPPDGLPPP